MRNPGEALIEAVQFLLAEHAQFHPDPSKAQRAKGLVKEIDDLVAYVPALDKARQEFFAGAEEGVTAKAVENLKAQIAGAPRDPAPTNVPDAGKAAQE